MAQLKYPKLAELDFGRLSASEEARVAPELLMAGYFDYQQAAYRIAARDGWIIVGPKGAGKSAAFEHLSLMWERQHDRFLSRWELSSFPVADVTALQVGSNPGPSSTRAAWEFLLLLRMFESLMRDNSVSHRSDVTQLKKDLVAAGLIEGPDLRTRFADWSRAEFRFMVAGSGVEGSLSESGATAMQISEIVKRAIRMISTPSQHLLAIDGLDSFFAQTDTQLESLASLVEAAADVNAFLLDTELRASAVLAIRSDMFRQLPSTDSAKLSDHAIELDWSRGGAGPGNELWELVSSKARTSVFSTHSGLPLGDVRKAYLGTPIGIGPHTAVPEYFLANTRLLPRDLIALLNELKKLHPGSGSVSEQSARKAVELYAETYFLREMQNNLSKVLPGASATKVADFIESLSTLDSRHFNVRDVRVRLGDSFTDDELKSLLRQLYQVGGLGVMSGPSHARHTNFIFRRTAGGGFSFIKDFVLHNALVAAWNLNW